MFCDCHSPVKGRACSPVIGVEAPRSISELWCEVGRTRALLLGDKPLSSPHLELSTSEYALWCHLIHVVWAHKVHSPASTVRMQAVGPGVPPVLYSQSHQHRSIGADPLKSSTRTSVVMHLDLPWELWKQPRHGPTSMCACLPAKPTAANAGPAPDTGAPIVHLDILHTLSLHRPLWLWCKSVDRTAMERGLRFQPCFRHHAAPGDQL